MLSRIVSLAALAALTACIPEHIEAPAIGPPAKANLRRGINLGNALDAPNEGEWGRTLSDTVFNDIATAGFDHVRIPIRFSGHAGDTAPFTISDAFMARADWAVDQAQRLGLTAIVDLHHYKELNDDPSSNADRFVGLWKQIAAHYRSRPDSVYLELLNEPTAQLTAPVWNALLLRALAAVRAVDPTRKVIVDSVFWAAAKELPNLELPASDPNLIASFHMYQPILFTHQGLTSFMPPEYDTMGILFPGPPQTPISPGAGARSVSWVVDWMSQYNQAPAARNPNGPAAIQAEFEFARAYAERTKRALYMGEFGVGDKADPASRVAWLRMVRKEAEKRGIGWAYWDDGANFAMYDDKTRSWNESLRNALLGP